MMRKQVEDIDTWEHRIEEKLKKDFPQEIDTLNQALSCIGNCINQSLLGVGNQQNGTLFKPNTFE
ncbi:hypothetical protein ACFLYF_03795 [Chloroflexota bacterium]